MSLLNTRLGSSIKSKIDALPDASKTDAIAVWTVVAEAIIDEITEHAEIKIGTLQSQGPNPEGGTITSTNTNSGEVI